MVAVLGKDQEIVMRYYGVTDEGNYDGKNILHIDRGFKAIAHEFDRPDDELLKIIAEGRKKLLAHRGGRVRPFKDSKILASWNGLAISAFIDAFRTTGRGQYLDAAVKSVDFLMSNLWLPGARLLHVWKDGAAKINGNLDDYAFLASALIDMFEVTFDDRYLKWAGELTNSMIEIFSDADNGGFYSAEADPDRLFHRLKTGTDQSIPSGNGVAAMNLLRLSAYRDNSEYKAQAEEVLRLYYNEAKSAPFNYASILSSAMFCIAGATEVTIVGNKDSESTKMMLRKIGNAYIPDMVIYIVDETAGDNKCLPQFSKGKGQKNGMVTVYVCKDFTCSEPITEPEEADRQFL